MFIAVLGIIDQITWSITLSGAGYIGLYCIVAVMKHSTIIPNEVHHQQWFTDLHSGHSIDKEFVFYLILIQNKLLSEH